MALDEQECSAIGQARSKSSSWSKNDSPEPFRFVQFCFMHIEETGVRAEVSAIQTRIRMRTCDRAKATTDVPPLASP